MKSRKKILYYLLTGLTTTSLTLSACSCNSHGGETEHEHAWSNWQTTTEASCKNAGEKQRSCECGELETQEIAKTSHTAGAPQILQEATCTETGVSATYCSDCGDKLSETAIEAKGHSYVDVAETVGDCYTEGYVAHKECSVCGDTQGKESTGRYHQVSVQTTITPATDHEDGKAYVKCYECGYDGRLVEDENGDPAPEYVILPMKHTLVTMTTVEATCYSDGETQVFCLDCVDENGKPTAIPGTAEVVSKDTVAHSFSVSVSAKTETCSEAGYTAHHVCSVCGEKGDDYSIVTPTHVFDEAGKCTREKCGVETFDYELAYDGAGTAIGYSIAKFHVLENDTRDNIIIPEKYGENELELPVISIAEEAFQNVTTITKVTLPKTVKEIASFAFENCSNLTEINLQNVEIIGESAFENCERMKTIAFVLPGEDGSLPEEAPIPFGSLSTLGEAAFKGCSSLTELELKSETLTQISDSAFENCTALAKVYVGTNITAIGENAFKNCSSIEQITVPYVGLTANDEETFSAIFGGNYELPSALKEITVLQATKLTSGAFKNVYAQVINLPATVTEIGEEAFAGCASLTNVAFAGKASKNDFSNIVKIGENAFKNSGLTTVILPFLGETAQAQDGTLAYAFGTNSNVVNVTLNAATKLYEEAFAGAKKLSYVKIPAVTEIGENAFNGCIALKTIQYANEKQANVFPASVTKIGLGAFTQINVTEITLPFVGESIDSENDYVGYVFGDLSAGNLALNVNNHRQLKKITVLQATKVNEDAFEGCEYLTDVVLPCTVETIEKGAFENCKRLKNVTVLKDESEDVLAYLTEIGENAFKNCENLISFSFDNRILKTIGESAFEACKVMPAFSFPENGFEMLAKNAFKACEALSTVKFGEDLKAIGEAAFAGCSNLKTVEFNEDLETIGEYAFNDCSSLTIVEFSENVNEIGEYAFKGCTKLSTVKMNETLVEIGESAFQNCTAMTEIKVPESVEVIGKGAFKGCTKLADVTVPFVGNTVNHDVTNGSFTWFFDCDVTELPETMKVELTKAIKLTNGAFTGYTGLTEIVLPATLTQINESAFENCSKLTKVTFAEGEWALERIGDMAFKKTAISEIALPASVKVIGTEAFSRNDSLTALALNEGLETVGIMAFEACNNLESVIFPASVKTIDDFAFLKCSKLMNVVIPATIEKIGNGAFEDCVNMQISKDEYSKKNGLVFKATELVFESGVTIGEYAFKNCEKLTTTVEFKAPATVVSNAFYGCVSIEKVFVQVATYRDVTVTTPNPDDPDGEPVVDTITELVAESSFGEGAFNSNEKGKAITFFLTEDVSENEKWTDWSVGVKPESTVKIVDSYDAYKLANP